MTRMNVEKVEISSSPRDTGHVGSARELTCRGVPEPSRPASNCLDFVPVTRRRTVWLRS